MIKYKMMKQILVFNLLIALAIGGYPVHAQVDLMDAVRQTAEMHNEQESENNSEESGNPTSGGNTDNAPSTDNEWGNTWNNILGEYGELLNSMEDKYVKCTALMILYVYEYESLRDATNAEANCKMKYDLYGMQLLAISASTTIMYCPEEMAQILEQDHSRYGQIYDDFLKATHITNNIPAIRLRSKLASLQERYSDIESGVPLDELRIYIFDYLIKFFRPEFIVYNTLDIGNKMEALGCGG